MEFKNPEHPKATDIARRDFLLQMLGANKKSKDDIIEISRDLAFEISSKFKDTFLLKWAENVNFEKPIHYIFLLNLEIDSRHVITFADRVEGLLPLNITEHQHIKRNIIQSFAILTIEQWNKMLGEFPITPVEETA